MLHRVSDILGSSSCSGGPSRKNNVPQHNGTEVNSAIVAAARAIYSAADAATATAYAGAKT